MRHRRRGSEDRPLARWGTCPRRHHTAHAIVPRFTPVSPRVLVRVPAGKAGTNQKNAPGATPRKNTAMRLEATNMDMTGPCARALVYCWSGPPQPQKNTWGFPGLPSPDPLVSSMAAHGTSISSLPLIRASSRVPSPMRSRRGALHISRAWPPPWFTRTATHPGKIKKYDTLI